MDILIATKNPGKFKEIAEFMRASDLNFVSLGDLGIEQDFPETASTFEENALGKARFYSELTGLPALADDSGIFISALADELGVKTRRWGAGEAASDEEWLAYFMKRMASEQDRNAKFVCAAAFVSPDRQELFMGETHGKITDQLEAPIYSGIPLSSVFKPEGSDKVYSLLSPEEKNKISHRGKAFAELFKCIFNSN